MRAPHNNFLIFTLSLMFQSLTTTQSYANFYMAIVGIHCRLHHIYLFLSLWSGINSTYNFISWDPDGQNVARVEAWGDVVECFNDKLSMWKANTFSIGARLLYLSRFLIV